MSTPNPKPNPDSTQPPLTNPLTTKKNYTYYHAGPLFTLSDLHTNTLLSTLIHSISSSNQKAPTFTPLVPQNIEARSTHPHSIRDQDIRSLLSSDLALFTFDGTELDSGTVVEFCVAKFADIPAVILRTDFRGGGDQNQNQSASGSGSGNAASGTGSLSASGVKADPWNLMCSFWPRCETVVVDSMGGYKAALARSQGIRNVDGMSTGVENVVELDSVGGAPFRAGEMVLEATARKVVEAMGRVVGLPSVLPGEIRESVWRWIAVMPGFREGSGEEEVKGMLEVLRGKEERGLY